MKPPETSVTLLRDLTAEYLGANRTALYHAVAKLRKSGKIRIDDDTLALA